MEAPETTERGSGVDPTHPWPGPAVDRESMYRQGGDWLIEQLRVVPA